MTGRDVDDASSGRGFGQVGDLLEWPVGIARLGVILCTAMAVVFGIGWIPHALDRLGDDAARKGALSFADRDVAGGNSIVPDQESAYQARLLIPRDSSYRVVVGSGLKEKTDLTERFAPAWLTYFLMPRRPSDSATWVICFGCDTSNLGGRFDVRWQDEEGISIGQVTG